MWLKYTFSPEIMANVDVCYHGDNLMKTEPRQKKKKKKKSIDKSRSTFKAK